MKTLLSLDDLTVETVRELSEEDVFVLLTKEISGLDKEKRSGYMKIISSAFDFRSISSKNRSLKADLGIFGFKFFENPKDAKYVMGVKRKIA